MNVGSETSVNPRPDTAQLVAALDRNLTVADRHARVGAWLQESQCDRLLVLDPANAAWLTAGGRLRTRHGSDHEPALWLGAKERWLLASDQDAPALLDLELTELGFQAVTWPWYGSRQALLDDLSRGHRVACDRPRESSRLVDEPLRIWRRELSPEEQKNLKTLGRIVSHALEATCRTIQPEEAERDVAAQLSHRLLHRSAEPVDLGVAGEGRLDRHGCCTYTAEPIGHRAVLRITARRFGLHVTASRTVSFGHPDDAYQKAHAATCKVSGAYVASTWPDSRPREIVPTGHRYCQLAGFDPDRQLGPPGQVTGWSPSELSLTPQTDDLLQPGWAVVWEASIGGALSCDTFLITPDGPKLVTPTEAWPLKRIRIQGMKLVRPDILQR